MTDRSAARRSPRRGDGQTPTPPVEPARPLSRARPDRQAWVRLGLETLAAKGVEAVRVEVLAKNLKVTKGSFYTRFADRNDLLNAILVEWRRATVTSIVENIWGRPTSGREKLQKLWRICLSNRIDNPGGAIESALSQWGTQNQAVRDLLARVDIERINFIAALYLEAGVAEPDEMAQLFYRYVLGANLGALRGGERPETQALHIRALLRID